MYIILLIQIVFIYIYTVLSTYYCYVNDLVLIVLSLNIYILHFHRPFRKQLFCSYYYCNYNYYFYEYILGIGIIFVSLLPI